MISMTGYGRGHGRDGQVSLAVEVKTINHRHLETIVKLPAGMWALESAVKEAVGQRLARGRAEVLVHLLTAVPGTQEPVVDLELAKKFLKALRAAGRQLDLPATLDLSQLARWPGVIRVEERPVSAEALRGLTLAVLAQALRQVVAMRKSEGRRLQVDVRSRLNQLRRLVTTIRTSHPKGLASAEERLRTQLAGFMRLAPAESRRLAREAVVQYFKADVTEELVRLQSHLVHFGQCLTSTAPVGRRLDFLIQEINREINTLGSKSSDAAVARHVVTFKEELEKIREQVQNIE